MNWDAIGAIGELVGALAVVLTLVYLSIQLRQNTHAVRQSTEREIGEEARTWMYKLIENPEIAELYRSGVRGEKLLRTDVLRFRLLMGNLFGHWNYAYHMKAFATVDNSNIAGVLSQPGGAEFWRKTLAENTFGYDQGFVEHMNKILAEVERNELSENQI